MPPVWCPEQTPLCAVGGHPRGPCLGAAVVRFSSWVHPDGTLGGHQVPHWITAPTPGFLPCHCPPPVSSMVCATGPSPLLSRIHPTSHLPASPPPHHNGQQAKGKSTGTGSHGGEDVTVCFSASVCHVCLRVHRSIQTHLLCSSSCVFHKEVHT